MEERESRWRACLVGWRVGEANEPNTRIQTNAMITDSAQEIREAVGVSEPPLEGLAAIVTGGGSGIGRATALALADAGAIVVIAGRRPGALEGTARLRGHIRTVAANVTREADARAIVNAALDAAGRLDVLVNNAGIVAPTPVGHTDLEVAQAIWRTNVIGPSLLVEAAVGELERTRGLVVNVSSTFGRKPGPGIAQYAASKAALEHLTRSWALELAARGIRVNAVSPGPTQSEALERSGLPRDEIEQIKERERAQIPLGRRGQPEDIASVIVVLASPAARWVTGQVIGIDGGFGLV
jgi:NAD(P)-dependent dehydrogenase (short-subunit alcohol dehydrogenase family)